MQNVFRLGLATALALGIGWWLLVPKTTAIDGAASSSLERPNILMVVFEDLSPRLGSYGDTVATTPVLDQFARESVLFENAFTTSGVCAPSRSALITGHHQQSIGTHHMRTRSPVPVIKAGGPIDYDAVPPADVKAFPELLRQAGYYTTNNGKTDYQFGQPFTIWDEQKADHPWRGAPSDAPVGKPGGQPFFAMVNILETHESYTWPTDRKSDNQLVELVRQRNLRDLAGKKTVTDPASVSIPPYLPDTEAVRADIARHYDNLAFAEQIVAGLLADLAEDGLAENTIVIITTDHGDGLPRMKRSLYDSGLHVPLMIKMPGAKSKGQRRADLVSFVDFAPTLLSLAGAKTVPDYPGRVFFGDGVEPAPEYIFAAADRHDNVPDRVRAVRDNRFKYIRNYVEGVPFYRQLPFRDIQPSMQALWMGLKAGSLTDIQAAYFTQPKPTEELYDLSADPHEVRNLAADPKHQATVARMRQALDSFLLQTGDMAEQSEAAMVAAMWPDMVQPLTAKPDGRVENGLLVLTAETQGASIGYRHIAATGEPTGPWKLYRQPITLADGIRIEAKAIRYGFKESQAVRFGTLE